MLSPIQLTPNMDMGTLVTAINNNFRQIEAESRTKIVRDEHGVDRILLGRDPKGQYLLAITVPGKSVVRELEDGS